MLVSLTIPSVDVYWRVNRGSKVVEVGMCEGICLDIWHWYSHLSRLGQRHWQESCAIGKKVVGFPSVLLS